VIEDLREFQRDTTVTADICLIGAGAAGITIAKELAGSSLQVCLVEGGGQQYEYQESQELYRGDSIGVPVSLDGGRLRFFGGTTNHWGGRCAQLDDVDFRRRDWIPHSGWPIDRAELDPYYARAYKVAGFSSEWRSDAGTLSYLNVALPPLNTEWLRPFLWHFTPAMKDAPVWKWAHAYGPILRESSNIRAILHANFTAFSTEADRSRVRSVTVKSQNGVSATISAKTFVLCCGGIENARLLLLAAEQNSGGFGNENDLVGRYFMQHPRGPAGLIVSAERMSRVQEQFNILRGADDLEIEIGISLTPQMMEKERLLNCSAVLQYQGDPESGVTAAQDIWRALLTGRWAPDMGEKVGLIAGDFGAFANGLKHRLSSGRSLVLEGSAGIPSRSAIVLLDLEQAPNPESRISLAQDRDALGLRRVTANWQLGELERRTAARFIGYIAAEFARLGIGRCRIEPWLQDDRIPVTDALKETYHYIGTTRMADDPRQGVVDRNCVVHGMENLYVAGSSVFPTAGHANPTLTVVALALRLADRIRRQPRPGAAAS
jgi:choline dehydrogenase-like flavoprotein